MSSDKENNRNESASEHLTEHVLSLVSPHVAEYDRSYEKKRQEAELERLHEEITALRSSRLEKEKWRKFFSWTLLVIFSLECTSGNAAFYLIATGVIHVSEWVASVFFVTVFGQVSYLLRVVAKYFFDTR